jgi:hypothetical protein
LSTCFFSDPEGLLAGYLSFFSLFFTLLIIPNLSFEQLSGCPEQTLTKRELGLLPQAKVPKLSESEWSYWSGMSVFAKDIPTWMLI